MSFFVVFLPLMTAKPPSPMAMKELPCVQDVKVIRDGQPKHRIIHILDWHHVEKGLFILDLEQTRKKKLTKEQAEKEYASFLADLQRIQVEQLEVLRFLCPKAVFSEGLSKEQVRDYRKSITLSGKLIRDLEERLPKETDPETKALWHILLESERESLLRLGVPAKFSLESGTPVLPLEDAALFAAAKPIKDDKIVFDANKVQARRDAIVRQCLTRKTAVIVLGMSHDLTDNLRRIAKTDFEYVRVKVKSLAE